MIIFSTMRRIGLLLADLRLPHPRRTLPRIARFFNSRTQGFPVSVRQGSIGQPGAVSIRCMSEEANPKHPSSPKSPTSAIASSSDIGRVIPRYSISYFRSVSTSPSSSLGSLPSSTSLRFLVAYLFLAKCHGPLLAGSCLLETLTHLRVRVRSNLS